MAEIVVSAEGRADRGKNAARRLRVKGLIPAVVYGGKGDAVSVAVDPKVLQGSPIRDRSQHDSETGPWSGRQDIGNF